VRRTIERHFLVERPLVAGGPLGWELSLGIIAGALYWLSRNRWRHDSVIPRLGPAMTRIPTRLTWIVGPSHLRPLSDSQSARRDDCVARHVGGSIEGTIVIQ
jgi:hypothetical protein